MKEKHYYKAQKIKHKVKNLRSWEYEQNEKGWKSTSGLVPVILIYAIISIAVEIFINMRPTREIEQDGTLR